MSDPDTAAPPAPTFPTIAEAFPYWLKLGFISFGGPAGQIALMHRILVEEKKWISEGRFLHALNYCTLLPGPEAHKLCVFFGMQAGGRLGGFLAGLAVLGAFAWKRD